MTRPHGFTLIELAIVLVIITILVGGLAVPLSAQIQARRIAETREVLQEAREALSGYAMTHTADAPLVSNHYLPCPDITGDGREDRNPLPQRTCIASFGHLPWVDLGIAPQDAWGNRLSYAVDPSFASATTGFSASLPLTASLHVCASNACASPDVAANVVFVLVSHGPNGWGARNISGSTLAAPTGPDESENLDADTRYVTRTPTRPDVASGEFDDLVAWVSHAQLIAQVCPAGSSCYP